MELISSFAVPVLIAAIILFALIKKQPVFEQFTEGVKQGAESAISVAPSVFALVTAVSILRVSGALELLGDLLRPVTDFLGIPPDIPSLALMRPFSGSGSTAILNDIFSRHGPDSTCGRIASVISGSTETTFYAIAVYYGAVKVKNTGGTVPAALCADLTGMLIACLIVK